MADTVRMKMQLATCWATVSTFKVQLRRKTGIVVSTPAAVCRAKWNAYTEDQLLHHRQGQGSGQYWEEHLKQVGARHAVQQRIPGKSAVLTWILHYT